MTAIFVAFTTCNATFLKYADKIPWLVSWFVPTVSVMNFIFMCLLFPFVMEGHILTCKLIQKRKTQERMRQSKANIRCINALKPISIKFGANGFVITRRTKVEYFTALFERTWNGTLI